MAGTSFVHLHTHSEFSLLDGAGRLDLLVERAAQFGMPALAITDHGTMHGAVDFYMACKKAGIKPIIGLEGYMAPDGHKSRSHRGKGANWHVTLLARDLAGYKNLLKLATIAAIEGFYQKPRIDRELLERHREGLIVLSGCMQGELSVALARDDYETAREAAAHYAEVLGRDSYFLEMQNHGIAGQGKINAGVRRLAADLGLKTVCTNDVHYLSEADAYAHEVLLCIGTGSTMSNPKRMRYRSDQLYMKTAEEMAAAFPDDLDALMRTAEIAAMCNVELTFGRTDLPVPDIPAGLSAIEYLRKLAYEGLHRRIGHVTEAHEVRLKHELDVIERTGFAEYILIVRDFAAFARSKGIHFGVRGSAAGSLVSYCVEITDVDPVHYDLTFERFLNEDRAEMPDIDMDFEDTRRQEVIEYVTNRYGQDHVAQIATFGTLAAKAALKDAGRALDMPLGLVNRVAAAVPSGNVTLEKALATSPQLAELVMHNDQVKHLFETAKRFEGIARHASVHAAGVVISRQPLVEHTPLQRSKDGGYVTQYPAGPLAKIGLLKMDFLGLINLTILGRTVEYVRRTRGIELAMDEIPLDDKATFELLGRGETIGVFQLESAGMRKHIRNLKPTSIKEVAAMVALYRPGPIKSIPDFIKAKHGLVQVTYLHPALEPLLRETYGVIVYQDQVLTVVREIAGFTMGEADNFRRAISKKLKDVLPAMESKFMRGAQERGIEPELAKKIYDLIEPFAGYGFNKAHAVCYALVAYQTAYLKANYPVEYMAALLACYVEKPDKMAVGLAEAKRMSIRVLGPDVNASECDFMPADGCIRFGLAAIKNVGHGVAEAIVAMRNEGGPYTSLVDFCRRLSGVTTITRATVETLIRCGAFDTIHPNRRALMSTVEQAVRTASALQRSESEGMCLFEPDDVDCGQVTPPDLPDFSLEELLDAERELLGVYISGHPLDRLPKMAIDEAVNSAAELSEMADDERVCLVGIITSVRRRLTQKGAAMAHLTLEDPSGRVAVTVFPRVLAPVDEAIVEQQAICVQGRVSVRDTGVSPDDGERSAEVIADTIMPIEARLDTDDAGPAVHIRLDSHHAHLLKLLRSTLERSPGTQPVYLHVPDGTRTRRVMAGLSVEMCPDTRAALERLVGRQAVWVE